MQSWQLNYLQIFQVYSACTCCVLSYKSKLKEYLRVIFWDVTQSFARRDLEFDRHDKVLEGEDGNTRMYRSKMLLTKAMRAIEDSLHWMSCAKSLNYSPMTLDHEHGGGNHQQLQRCVVGFDHCKCVHFIDLYITHSLFWTAQETSGRTGRGEYGMEGGARDVPGGFHDHFDRGGCSKVRNQSSRIVCEALTVLTNSYSDE